MATLAYNIQNQFNNLYFEINSPILDWVNNTYKPQIQNLIETLNYSSKQAYENFFKLQSITMFEYKWFPGVVYLLDRKVLFEIYDILLHSRGKSKRREKRIDNIIISNYSSKEIQRIKNKWKKSDLESHIKKILCQAIDSHIRGEYALCIAALATMWEGLIHYKLNIKSRLNQKETKKRFNDLISLNEYDEIVYDFYEKFIVSQCNTPDDVIEGVPNRNAISHSKYKKYPNKKASLNAILLTDFIISLEAKETLEV